MRKSLFICLMTLVSLGLFAQEETSLLTTRATSLSRQYLRPSMSRLFIIDGSSTSRTAVTRLMNIPDLKFDQNTINDNVFVIDEIPAKDALRDSAVKAKIANVIVGQKIGNKIMKNWFPSFTQEAGYGIETLMSRGQFAATDNDILKSNASQRQTVLNELGEKLIDRSYAIFYLIQDASFVDKKGKKHEQVKIVPYVYKLNFNEEVRSDFYNNHYMNASGIDDANFPLVYVMNAKDGKTPDPSDIDETTYEDLMTIIGKHVADFQVKTPVAATNPVRAKIGKKEGVRIDKRFAVMEYRMDKEGNEYAKRIATVRACKIADNNAIATGNTEDLTKFYYVKGRPAHEGMTLVENPDFGMVIEAQYNITGPYASIGYRLGRLFNAMPGFIFYINAGVASDESGKIMKVLAITDKNSGEFKKTAVLKAGLGVAKEFNFARNFVLTPSIGAGILWPIGAKELTNISANKSTINVSYDPDKSKLDSYYIDGAVKLGYMVTREIQVFAEAGYNVNILGDQFKFMRDLYYASENKDSKDPGKIRIGGGVKVYF